MSSPSGPDTGGPPTGPGRILRPIIFGFLRLVVSAIAHWPGRNP